jgi:hypothetical protein
MHKGFLFTLMLLGLVHLPLPATGSIESVSLPMSIDYPMLRSLIIQAAYPDPDTSAVLLDEEKGCKRVVISGPRVKEKEGFIEFETKVKVKAGIVVFGSCVMPVEWEGYLIFIQHPIIDKQWSLSFKNVNSTLLNKERESAGLAGMVWNLVKSTVYGYIEGIKIDLAPPVTEMKSFLKPLFPQDQQARAETMMDSMRPGQVRVTPRSLRIEILTEVELAPEQEEELEISREEWRKFIETWEVWDAYLVLIITSLTKEPLSEEDRRILLETLLETRHQFFEKSLGVDIDRDFVREQFILAWQKMSPVFRNHFGDDLSQSLLGYLAFFTASDALTALDKIGPTLGIEISRNGLIRLARLVVEGEITLEYRPGVNLQLREVLGLGPPPESEGPAFDLQELPMKEPETGDLKRAVGWFRQLSLAWAENTNWKKELEQIRPWLYWKSKRSEYLERLRTLLRESSDKALTKSKRLELDKKDFFRVLVASTAWQESCLRQFEVKQEKITYCLSYNGTSVGLMQINERVWRGMYEPRHLRWDTEYNAMAGCEILELYLRRYALRRLDKAGLAVGEDLLARLVYALYNGGPGQFKKFLKRRETGRYYLSDKLFFEKYNWVKRGHWDEARKCLIAG